MPDLVFPEWIDTLLTHVIAVGVVSGAITAAVILLKKTGAGLRWLTEEIRKAAHDAMRDVVQNELEPNGGENIRDVVDRTERYLYKLSGELEEHTEDFKTHMNDYHAEFYDHMKDLHGSQMGRHDREDD